MGKYSRCKVKSIDNKMDKSNLSQQVPNATTREKVAVFLSFSRERRKRKIQSEMRMKERRYFKTIYTKRTTPYQWNANDYHRRLIIRFI